MERDLEKYDAAKNGRLRRSDYVKVFKVSWISVDVTLTLQDQLIPLTETDMRRMVRERMGIKCGFFKLESDRELTPREALLQYRRRASVEQLISSLKRITGIKPMRVWNPDSVDGSMVLALLSEAVIAMARCCMDGTEVTVTDEDGVEHTHLRKPSTESIVVAPTHLTLTRFRDRKGPHRTVTSNWNPISREIIRHILFHEGPDWGSRKVPRPTA